MSNKSVSQRVVRKNTWWRLLLAVCLVAHMMPCTSMGQERARVQLQQAKEEKKEKVDEVLLLTQGVFSVDLAASSDAEALARWTGAYGINVAPVDPTLRDQLQLPEGEAVVVVGFAKQGNVREASLKVHDVLVGLGKNPDPTVPLTVTLYRQGKAQAFALPAATPAKTLWIGVNMEALDDKPALQAQLGLPAGEGLLLTHIYPNSPAEKAGLKLHDVVIASGDAKVASSDDLANAVQKSERKPIAIRMLRQAKPLTIYVTPEVRPQDDTQVKNVQLRYNANTALSLLDNNKDLLAFKYYTVTPQITLDASKLAKLSTDLKLNHRVDSLLNQELAKVQHEVEALQKQATIIQDSIQRLTQAAAQAEVKPEKK